MNRFVTWVSTSWLRTTIFALITLAIYVGAWVALALLLVEVLIVQPLRLLALILCP